MAYERQEREDSGALNDDFRFEAQFEDTRSPDRINYIEQLAAEYLSYAPDYPITDWRKPPRPKSAGYMRPRCRMTPDGGGGAPLQRPSSAPAGRRPAKTERWRESGLRRWPKEADKIPPASEVSDGDPLRRRLPKQPDWTGELWVRSLRRPGVEIQDPAYHDVCQRGMRELHEEWQAARPVPVSGRRPQSARAGSSRGSMPYNGATTNWKVALPHKPNPQDWVLRPVSTGKMSMNHFSGRRYTFNKSPRFLEWNEYVATVDPAAT